LRALQAFYQYLITFLFHHIRHPSKITPENRFLLWQNGPQSTPTPTRKQALSPHPVKNIFSTSHSAPVTIVQRHREAGGSDVMQAHCTQQSVSAQQLCGTGFSGNFQLADICFYIYSAPTVENAIEVEILWPANMFTCWKI
jgi:hypothetical protein